MGKWNEFSVHPIKIVAKFSYFKDREYIRINAAKRLKGSKVYANEQFPPEIEEKRRKLYPGQRQAKKDNKRVQLVRDVLYIDGKEYTPPESAPSPTPAWNNRTPSERNPKRARVSSTPDNTKKGHAGEQTYSDLKFLSLNVCGIKTRLNYAEFTDFISKYDIIGLTETKTDDSDSISLPGYVLFTKNRHTLSNVRSGGILVAIRESIVKYVHIIKTDCKYALWFKISKSLFNTCEDVLFGVCYIPPEGSKYSSNDCFLEIEQD